MAPINSRLTKHEGYTEADDSRSDHAALNEGHAFFHPLIFDR